jgi:hypothetical protein
MMNNGGRHHFKQSIAFWGYSRLFIMDYHHISLEKIMDYHHFSINKN